MRKKLNCILLIDDNDADNYYHQTIIEQLGIANSIQFAENGLEAIDFLRREGQVIPELIFLDINMPKMNGWEFLEEYKHLDAKQRSEIIIVMLTTSANPDDVAKTERIPEINGFQVKPLTGDMLNEIIERYFSDK